MGENTPKWFARQRRDGSWYAGLASVGWNLADTCAADFPGKDGKERCEMAVAAVNSHAALRAALESLIKYAVWQVKEGADYHPTMPSAIAAARRALEEA